MTKTCLSLDSNLREYLLAHSLREHPLLQELREVTARRHDSMMQISPEQGQFMAMLVKLLGATSILEIGTFTGYSSLVMAMALPEQGRITTLDVNPETNQLARSFWERAGLAHKITAFIEPALATLDKLSGPFDLCFIDADKANYDAYYEKALSLLRTGGLILVDNVLWDGKVADPHSVDPDTMAIKALNQKIFQDQRVDLSMLALADGLSLVRKI